MKRRSFLQMAIGVLAPFRVLASGCFPPIKRPKPKPEELEVQSFVGEVVEQLKKPGYYVVSVETPPIVRVTTPCLGDKLSYKVHYPVHDIHHCISEDLDNYIFIHACCTSFDGGTNWEINSVMYVLKSPELSRIV